MADLILAVPGDLTLRTGGYIYDSRILAELASRRRAAAALPLPADFPLPSSASIAEAMRRLGAVGRDSTLVVDGLAYGALPAERIVALGRPVVALVHHPLALETGLAPNTAERLKASERAALAVAAAVIVTSETTRELLAADFGVSKDRVSVAEPGVEPAERAAGSGGPEIVLLTVATLTPRKNHATLARALGRLPDLAWRWRIVGSFARDPDAADRLKQAVADAGIAHRVDFDGEADAAALKRAYALADIFALPSRFEGYGMAYAEALAHGLPVIAGAGGATARTVPEAAGAVIDPDDIDGLAAALRRLIADPTARRAASDAAWAHGRTLPSWADAADVFERVIDDVGHGA